MKEKIQDMIGAAKGEVGKMLLEEATPALISEILKGTVIEGITQAVGVAVPGIGNVMISYKQKKLERNFEKFISQIVVRQDEINERLAKLEDVRKVEIQSLYFGLIADYASETKQEKKIEYMVNGFINITSEANLKEDVVMMYYDTLEQLSILDLRVLRLYVYRPYIDQDDTDNIVNIMKDYQLDHSQVEMIKEKLLRNGLLESRNDTDMDENIKNMAQYLEDVTKGKKNPKLKRLNRISKSESYKVTRYGSRFYRFFTEIVNCKESNDSENDATEIAEDFE